MQQCQLPVLNKENGIVNPCQNTEIQTFTYKGNDFYFCSEHYKLFSENIEALYKALEKEVENNMFTQN